MLASRRPMILCLRHATSAATSAEAMRCFTILPPPAHRWVGLWPVTAAADYHCALCRLE
jgi:hypothetical protein